MNIVIISDNGSVTGGGAKIAILSTIGMANRGHLVYFLCATRPIDRELEQTQNVRVICTDQFAILRDPIRARAVAQGIWNRRARAAMRDLLDDLKPSETVVHLHLWSTALSSSVLREAIGRGYPVACTLHDYLLACPTGTLFDHQMQTICHRTPMSPKCLLANCDSRNFGHKLWRVARQIVQTSLGRIPSGIGHVVALSPFSYNVMKPLLPRTAEIAYISNFVDAVRGAPANVAGNHSFLFSGRLVPGKGSELFAECARNLKLSAVFVGDGPSRMEVQRIAPRARITGWLPHEEVEAELRKARALVFPALWYEVQPLVVLEAAAIGIPAVVPDTCAAREMVEDGVTGLWFRGGDKDDLEAKLRLLQNPTFAARLGKAAYNRYWADPPLLETHLDHLEALYGRMLNSALKSVPA